jgi:hypothetical protein
LLLCGFPVLYELYSDGDAFNRHLFEWILILVAFTVITRVMLFSLQLIVVNVTRREIEES